MDRALLGLQGVRLEGDDIVLPTPTLDTLYYPALARRAVVALAGLGGGDREQDQYGQGAGSGRNTFTTAFWVIFLLYNFVL